MLSDEQLLFRAAWYLSRLDEMQPWARWFYLAIVLREMQKELRHADR